MHRLGIVIPYRDRQQHLMQVVPHLAMYFTRDKTDSALSVHIVVVEQSAGAPFNRGLLCNIGFKLLRDAIDYVCFHDVDYLPMWADYRCPEQPTMIVWDGFHARPIDPANPAVGQIVQNPAACFSAVVLMRSEQFERANGFATGYWGWGFEDVDLKRRLEQIGCRIEHRRGTFQALNHRNAGYLSHMVLSPAHVHNRAVYNERWRSSDCWRNDGLNSTAVAIVNSTPLTLPPHARRDIRIEQVLVDIQMSAPIEPDPAALQPA
jgi:N-terminal region of glycosyl transferase group 7/N-terminal domain of galactosyltransferase